VATSDSAIDPVPSPTSSPQSSISCQLAVMKTVRPLPTATTTSAPMTTRRMPKRSISAAANGAVSPYSAMLSATAAEIVDTDQPNSARSGSISTPGTARNAAAPTSARNVTAATHQAGWIRVVRTAGGEVTPDSMPEGPAPETVARRPPCARIRP
jgi:hypothetical protein